MTASWHIPDDQRELVLMVDGKTFATITRWNFTAAPDYGYWNVEFFDSGTLGEDRLSEACRRATAAAGVTLDPPPHLLKQWGEDGSVAAKPEPIKLPVAKPGFTNADFARYAATVASKATQWSRSILDDEMERAPSNASIERFAMEIAGVLDRLSEASTRRVPK